MSNNERCWFCGDDAVAQDIFVAGLHRDVKYTHLLIAVWKRWIQIEIPVPRCHQCHVGHSLERTLMPGVPACVLVLAVVIGGMYEEGWITSPPPDSAGRSFLITVSIIASAVAVVLSLLGWIFLQFGWLGSRRWLARPRRHARKHPAVRKLLEDGWRYGAKPNFFR